MHLEVTDATTEAFIAALRQFVARRGLPLKLFSDHGSNFVAANFQLKELSSLLNDNGVQSQIVNACTSNGVELSYIPERSPNFGGLWEAAVKMVKKHLYIVTKTYCYL